MLPPPPSSTLFPYTTLFRSTLFQSDAGRLRERGGTEPNAISDPISAWLHRLLPDGTSCRCKSSRSRGERRGWREGGRSEEHTSELQSQSNIVCRLLLEKKKN